MEIKFVSSLRSLFTASMFFILLAAGNPIVEAFFQQKKELNSPMKDVVLIEKKIFELLNKERQKQGLAILRLSEPLTLLARKHCQDMAAHENLSHLSSSGEDYTDRLVEDGFYFKKNGENVARSDSFSAELIQEGFMKSPGHRENILDPDFEEVGIGTICSEKKAYYVTQDFLLGLVPVDEQQAKKQIQRKINELRKESSLAPLVFKNEADDYARQYSSSRAKGELIPALPARFGAVLILYKSSPSLENVYSDYKEKAMDEIYETAGLGVCFLRNEKNRGGSYFITLLLFPENKYKKWSKEKLREVIFSSINKIRTQAGLPLFTLDDKLSTQAETIASGIYAQRGKMSANVEPGTGVLYFVNEDPNILPKGTKQKIENDLRNFHRIGIGIVFAKSEEFPSGVFWVAILLME
jgi:uncharacterized protein YkwD